MSKEKTSFEDLLALAPAAEEVDQIVLTGMLARSKEDGQFMLKLENGRCVSLPVTAVRDCKLLARSFGNVIVRLELDSTQVPPEIASLEFSAKPTGGEKLVWLDLKHATHDMKAPPIDRNWYTIFGADKPPSYDQQFGPVDPGQEQDYWSGLPAGYGFAPFSLATPHQVPANYIAAMEAALTGPYTRGRYTPTIYGGHWGDPPLPKAHTDPQAT